MRAQRKQLPPKSIIEQTAYGSVKTICYHASWKDAPLQPDVYRICMKCGVRDYQLRYTPVPRKTDENKHVEVEKVRLFE